MGFPIAARFAHPDAGWADDQKLAAQHLKPGEVYVVRRLEVGSSSSTLRLDVPGARDIDFNTVMFEAAEAPHDWDDDETAGAVPMSTAGDLLDYLAAQPRDRKVVLEKDAEGNGYSPLASAGVSLYVADSTYSGEVYPTPEEVAVWVAAGSWTEADEAGRYEPGDDAERVIVLGPVN
jgi:hypothetical protein